MFRRAGPRRRDLAAAGLLVLLGTVGPGCGTSDGERTATTTPPAAGTATAAPSDPGGSLAGLSLDTPDGASRQLLLDTAEEVVDDEPSPRQPLEITDTEDDFVVDAQNAWTLALAHHVAGDPDHAEASEGIVDAWVTTTSSLRAACPDTGACSTSLMVSRAAPGLVHAVDLLRADGEYDDGQIDRFHTWLREVILPAASDRDNNWGDAGTYLRAVAAAELGDDQELEDAAELWRERIDLVQPDGQIPEEVRRGDSGLMYSQEALDYKVATADVLARHGLDVWEVEGADGGSLRRAVDLVATCLRDPGSWPGPVEDELREPTPAGMWPIVAARWPDGGFDDLADEAARHDDDGHSAITWTAVTHPDRR